MKAKIFSLMALVLGMVSCQTEPEGFDVIVDGEQEVTVTVAIPEAETRADADWSNSKKGAFENVDFTQYTIRYIFDVYYGETCNRQVKYSDDQSVAFGVRLVPDRDYQFVVWADVVEDDGTLVDGVKCADMHYVIGESLRDIKLNTTTWNAMDETRDAFTGTLLVENFNGSQGITVNLTRPFAKLRVVTTDFDELAKFDIKATYAKVAYTTPYVSTFNALEGKAVRAEENGAKMTHEYTIKSYEDEKTGDEHTIFSDYIFTVDPGVVKFNMEVFEGVDMTKLIKANSFNTDIQVRPNYITTLKGDVLTTGGNVTITVNPGFAQDEIVETYVDTAEDLQHVINNAANDQETVVVLGGDVDLSELLGAGILSTRAAEPTFGLEIPARKVVTLDLNGKRVYQTKAQSGKYAMIENNGTLTICNSANTNGTLSYGDTATLTADVGYASNTIQNNGVLTINEGVVITNTSGEGVATYGYPHVIDTNGTLTINGGTLTNEANYSTMRIWTSNTNAEKCKVTINGGTFNGCIDFQAHNNNSATIPHYGTLTVNGGTFKADTFTKSAIRVLRFAVNANDMHANINGGTFNGKVWVRNFGTFESTPKIFDIYNGTFTVMYEGFDTLLANGYAFVEGENGTYTVENVGHYTDTEGNYYITNAKGLAWVSENVNTMEFYVSSSANIFDNATVYLANDIDLGGAEWRPIGDYAFSRTSFNGVFDGQGYTVSNFKVTEPVRWTEKVTEASYGFFGNVKGTIKNLTIKNATVNPEGGRYSAALVGRLHDGGCIENCHVENSSVTILHWQVGGLVGQNNNGNISDCSVVGSTITGKAAVGAIVGMDMTAGEHTIENCRVANTALVQNESFGASYDASYGLAVGLVNAKGIVLNVENVVAENNTIKDAADNTLVGDIVAGATVTINGVSIATTAEQLENAIANDSTVIIGADIEDATIQLPEKLSNFTLRAAEGVSLKNTTISTADGNAYHYENLTFDGITFDNSRIVLTGWRTGEVLIKNLVVTNCVFENIEDTTNNAAVHINMNAAEAVENFTFTNNVINGLLGGSKSGVYAQVTGSVVFENNVINNVSFRPYVIQITTDDAIADTFTVRGNTFSGSSVGRAQGLGNNAEGTDSVKLVVSGNIFKDITESQQICYWNFNPATTTADLSKNYYSLDIENNPSSIYYNAAAASVEDLVEMGVFPYYTALNADGTINLDSLKQAE